MCRWIKKCSCVNEIVSRMQNYTDGKHKNCHPIIKKKKTGNARLIIMIQTNKWLQEVKYWCSLFYVLFIKINDYGVCSSCVNDYLKKHRKFRHWEASMRTSGRKKTLRTSQKKQPMYISQRKQPLRTSQMKQRMRTRQRKQPMRTRWRKQPMKTRKLKQPCGPGRGKGLWGPGRGNSDEDQTEEKAYED